MTRRHLARWCLLSINTFLCGEDGLFLGAVCIVIRENLSAKQQRLSRLSKLCQNQRTFCYPGPHLPTSGSSAGQSMGPMKPFPWNTHDVPFGLLLFSLTMMHVGKRILITDREKCNKKGQIGIFHVKTSSGKAQIFSLATSLLSAFP